MALRSASVAGRLFCLPEGYIHLYDARSFAARFLAKYGNQGRILTNCPRDRVATIPREHIQYRQILLEIVEICVVDERRKIQKLQAYSSIGEVRDRIARDLQRN
jgi:hypothetical protein